MLSLTTTHAVQSALRARLTRTRTPILPASRVAPGDLLVFRVRSLALNVRRAAPMQTRIRRQSARLVNRASTLVPVPRSATRATRVIMITISTLRLAVLPAWQERALAAALQSARTAKLDMQTSTPTRQLLVTTAELKLGIGWPASEPQAVGNASPGTLTLTVTQRLHVSYVRLENTPGRQYIASRAHQERQT
jgi:hypothetical protein